MESGSISNGLGDVTDPSDWEWSKVPRLSDLDSLTRCYICKDFLKAPVITGCNHTFCSHCIREYLLTKNYCPLCKAEQFESNLKKDVLLEEVVSAFQGLRPDLLRALKKPKTASDTVSAGVRGSSEEVIEVLSDGNTCAEPPVKVRKMDKETKKAEYKKENKGDDCSEIPIKDELVECPICSEIMSARELQTTHIDLCLKGVRSAKPMITNSGHAVSMHHKKRNNNGIVSFFKPAEKTSVLSSSPQQPVIDHKKFYFNEPQKHKESIKKLSKLDFASLSTQRLKEKLSYLKLSTQGSRSRLESRYNYYYVLYNSNSDSNRPVSEKILRHRLNQWELSNTNTNGSKAVSYFNGNKGLSHKSITDRDFSAAQWTDVYKREFVSLTKAARKPSSKKKDSVPTVVSKESASKSASEQATAAPVPKDNSHDNKSPEHDSIMSLDFRSAISNSSLFIHEQEHSK